MIIYNEAQLSHKITDNCQLQLGRKSESKHTRRRTRGCKCFVTRNAEQRNSTSNKNTAARNSKVKVAAVRLRPTSRWKWREEKKKRVGFVDVGRRVIKKETDATRVIVFVRAVQLLKKSAVVKIFALSSDCNHRKLFFSLWNDSFTIFFSFSWILAQLQMHFTRSALSRLLGKSIFTKIT